MTLDFEDLPVSQVTVHGLHNFIREAHTKQGVRDLFVPVNLTQFEEAPGNGRRVLEGSE